MYYKQIIVLSVAGLVLATALGCASRSKALDPAELQSRTAAAQAEFRALIATEITDPTRAATFAALADQRDELMARHSESVQRYADAMRNLSADFDASREDFETLVQDYGQERRAFQEEFVALMDQMKATTTEKEWKKLAKFEIEELGPTTAAHSTGGN